MQALLELDCIPAGMELFPASSEEQWELIKRVIDNSDYYLLIIGGRYGSVNDKGISYTQMEYEYALSTGKPIIAFLPKYPDKIPCGKCEESVEKRKKLNEFKTFVSRKAVKYWTDPSNLGSLVSRSTIKLTKTFPATGWVRADSIVDEVAVKEISRLQKENKQLKQHLEQLSVEIPSGAEQLAQGNDIFTVTGIYYESSSRHDIPLDFTWNQLFKHIAPYLIAPCNDILFKSFFRSLLAERILELYPQKDDVRTNVYLSDDSFNAIKIQFRALGLIAPYQDSSARKQTEEYWKLTPYGDHQMMKLLAIQKNQTNL